MLDIEIYTNVTEPVYPAQGRDRVQIRFRILLRYCKGSEHLEICHRKTHSSSKGQIHAFSLHLSIFP